MLDGFPLCLASPQRCEMIKDAVLTQALQCEEPGRELDCDLYVREDVT